jgi:ribosome-binding ATPase YchF (GTP1/OBG family)
MNAIREKIDSNQDGMESKMDANQGKMMVKLDAHHERMMARMDFQLEKMEAVVDVFEERLNKMDTTDLEDNQEKSKGIYEHLRLQDSIEMAMREVGCWCEMAASLGVSHWSRELVGE